jgi:hypothetical protein
VLLPLFGYIHQGGSDTGADCSHRDRSVQRLASAGAKLGEDMVQAGEQPLFRNAKVNMQELYGVHDTGPARASDAAYCMHHACNREQRRMCHQNGTHLQDDLHGEDPPTTAGGFALQACVCACACSFSRSSRRDETPAHIFLGCIPNYSPLYVCAFQRLMNNCNGAENSLTRSDTHMQSTHNQRFSAYPKVTPHSIPFLRLCFHRRRA